MTGHPKNTRKMAIRVGWAKIPVRKYEPLCLQTDCDLREKMLNRIRNALLQRPLDRPQ